MLDDAWTGHGRIGRLTVRTNALHYVQDNQDKIRPSPPASPHRPPAPCGAWPPAQKVSGDCATSIAGYPPATVISVICRVLTDAALKIMGIPFAGLIALFVAIADLIPTDLHPVRGRARRIPGALLAIPVAGIIQVILRDVRDHRRGITKPVPTTGEDETPVAQGRGDPRRSVAKTEDAAPPPTFCQWLWAESNT